jgi:hypothetical protein
MSSYWQVEANRRNALKSTGPRTEAGKQASRRNAIRHGLTAETVIGTLEDAEDYKGFEAAITADYDAQSAVERELVLRLASVLWRLRRAMTMETGLFEIQAGHLQDYREKQRSLPSSRDVIRGVLRKAEPSSGQAPVDKAWNSDENVPDRQSKAVAPAVEFARCFLRQAGRILFALESLDRRKPQERRRTLWPAGPEVEG